LQAACLVLAAMAAVLLAWVVTTTHAVYEGRQERAAARMPVWVDKSAEATVRWLERTDTWRQRQFSVVYIEPLTDSAPLPPGLLRWPKTGEAFVSPALAEADPATRTRYGKPAGTISRAGLVDPGEFLVYARLPASVPRDESLSLTGFGVRGAVNPEFFASQGTARAETDLYWLFGPLLALPTGTLLVVASRLGARARDRRLAVLHAMGAGRSVRAWIAVGEAARPLALGTLLAAVPLSVPCFTDLTLPLTGYRIASYDLSLPAFLLTSLGVWAALCCLFALLHLRIRTARGTRPRPRGALPPTWPGHVCGAGLTLAAVGAAIGESFGIRLFFLGTVLTLAGFPPLLGRAAAGAGARAARRSRSAAGLIGGRWVAAHPAVLARAAAAIVVGLGLLSQAQLFMSALNDESRAATQLTRELDDRLLAVRTPVPVSPKAATRFTAALSPTDRLLVINDPGGTTPPLVQGTCANLAALSRMAACPAEGPRAAREVFAGTTPRTEALRWLTQSDVLVEATTSSVQVAGARTLLVLSPDTTATDRVKRAAFTTLPLPSVTTPGEEWVTGAATMARISDWMLLAAGLGLALLLLTGTAALTATHLDRAEELRPLASYTSGVRFHLRVAWWGLGVPLACAVLLSSTLAALLAGFNYAFIYWGAQRPPFTTIGWSVVAVLVLCAAGTAAGGWLSSRFTHRWVPRGGD
jgi:hypothetical protein